MDTGQLSGCVYNPNVAVYAYRQQVGLLKSQHCVTNSLRALHMIDEGRVNECYGPNFIGQLYRIWHRETPIKMLKSTTLFFTIKHVPFLWQ
jgi:hypothetical protein